MEVYGGADYFCTHILRRGRDGTAKGAGTDRGLSDSDLSFERRAARFHAWERGMLLLYMATVKAIYPGTFDPLTNGHLDLIARGSKIVDQLVVAILRNSDKGAPLFSVAERLEMIAEAIGGFGNVSVTTFDGLLVDFARAQGAKAVLRGIRAITDYEYEFPMAMMNRKLDPNLETLFMMPTEQYTYVSSRLIKGVFKLGGDVSALVPPLVMRRMKAKG
jgi:pantetheine-phosphate adenylyltransferase